MMVVFETIYEIKGNNSGITIFIQNIIYVALLYHTHTVRLF